MLWSGGARMALVDLARPLPALGPLRGSSETLAWRGLAAQVGSRRERDPTGSRSPAP